MRAVAPRLAMPVLLLGVTLASCRGGEALMQPIALDPVPDLGSQAVTLVAGSAPAEYMAVVANTMMDGTTTVPFSIRGDGIAPSLAPSPALVPASAARPSLAPDAAITGDVEAEARRRAAERAELGPRIAAAQAWFAARAAAPGANRQAVPLPVSVGDLVRVNVNGDSACVAPRYHVGRVAAISQRAIVVDDTLNPRSGFSDADFRRFAARFDTLVYPLDSAAFGTPTDLDQNGHIVLVFTRAVNEATPRNAASYVGGFAFSRDLFPVAGGSRTQPCAGSNEGEYFYLLAPDPRGLVNGNVRTTSFVDSVTTSVLAHELQHLINAGRRLYVTKAPAFEEKWLDEGLSHVAEELLFERESGLPARTDIGLAALRASARTLVAYNSDMGGNQGRYRSYLSLAGAASPFGHADNLAMRGGSWSLLRYLLDHAGGTDGDHLFRLANARSTGRENLAEVFGPSVATQVRDWNVSHVADDLDADAAWQQPSWNWRDIFQDGGSAGYPLAFQSLQPGTVYQGAVISGGAAYFRITVPANSSATLSLSEQLVAPSSLSLVTVRTR